jgi:hypothetical protein
MTGEQILQYSILADIFFMGVLVSVAIRHLYLHFKHKNDPIEVAKPHEKPQGAHLPPAVRERMIEKSEAEFESVLNKSAEQLQHDLQITTGQLNKKLERLGSEIIGTEMRRYHLDIEKLRETTETAMTGAQSQISQHQEDLKTKMAKRQEELEAQMVENVKAEQEVMIKNIDTKLADAVISFLTETMQHDIDLGSQSKYLISMLNEHKDELKKGVADEA